MQASTVSTCDISTLLYLALYNFSCFAADDSTFESDSPEECSHVVDIAEYAGHSMTFKILKNEIQKVFFLSNIHPSDDPLTRTLPLTQLLFLQLLSLEKRPLKTISQFLILFLPSLTMISTRLELPCISSTKIFTHKHA